MVATPYARKVAAELGVQLQVGALGGAARGQGQEGDEREQPGSSVEMALELGMVLQVGTGAKGRA